MAEPTAPAPPSVLFIDQSLLKRSRTARVLGAVSPRVDIARDLSEVEELPSYGLIVLNVDGLDQRARDQLRQGLSRGVTGHVIVVSPETWGNADIGRFAAACGATAVLGAGPHVDRELVIAAKKLLTNDVFGLDKYFGWGAASTRTPVGRLPPYR